MDEVGKVISDRTVDFADPKLVYDCKLKLNREAKSVEVGGGGCLYPFEAAVLRSGAK
jgi:hypothetical protein